MKRYQKLVKINIVVELAFFIFYIIQKLNTILKNDFWSIGHGFDS